MKCAVYCRLSREDEGRKAESESIANQKSLLIGYALERGWEICGIYCDEDRSGVDRERPEFLRLMADAEARRFDLVLCKTLSRFTRDMELVEKIIHGDFPRWGLRFIAVADNADTEVRGNKKARQITGLVNEWYLEDLSENVRLVLDHKRRQGRYIGAFPLYGYRRDPDDRGRLVPDPEAAAVVGWIFHLAAEGMSAGRIAALLNGEGVLNPTAYKKAAGLRYVNGRAGEDSRSWSRNTVSRILKNEMYTGVMVQGRLAKESYKSGRLVTKPPQSWIRVPGTHAAIVDQKLFEKAQRKPLNDKT